MSKKIRLSLNITRKKKKCFLTNVQTTCMQFKSFSQFGVNLPSQINRLLSP